MTVATVVLVNGEFEPTAVTHISLSYSHEVSPVLISVLQYLFCFISFEGSDFNRRGLPYSGRQLCETLGILFQNINKKMQIFQKLRDFFYRVSAPSTKRVVLNLIVWRQHTIVGLLTSCGYKFFLHTTLRALGFQCAQKGSV